MIFNCGQICKETEDKKRSIDKKVRKVEIMISCNKYMSDGPNCDYRAIFR